MYDVGVAIAVVGVAMYVVRSSDVVGVVVVIGIVSMCDVTGVDDAIGIRSVAGVCCCRCC